MLEKIRNDLKAAMKAGDKTALSTLRMVLSAIKSKQVEAGEELSEADVIAVIEKGVKTRKESIEQFKKGGRDDLVAKEEAELKVLEKYLPQRLSEEEVRSLVDKIIAEEGASNKGDIGKVMKRIMAEYRGQVDGKQVQQIVAEKLS